MKARLSILTAAILALPLSARLLAGNEFAFYPAAPDAWLPLFVALGALLLSAWLADAWTQRRQQSSLWRSQRAFLLACMSGGAATGILFAYLNLFVESALLPASNLFSLFISAALTGALLMPAILMIRQTLGSGLTARFAHLPSLPALAPEPVTAVLLALAVCGLMGGATWPHALELPFWLAPLLLLVALQLAWHESTVFDGLKKGDWSRPVLGALSGMLAGFLAALAYHLAGGELSGFAGTPQSYALFAIFGLFALQLGDVIAELWRGKTRGEVFKRKPFPIPVVTRKEP